MRFQNQSVVVRSHLRPAYPPEVFLQLQNLMMDEPRALALDLLDAAERIDAVDLSPQMLALARMLPNGQLLKIRWQPGRRGRTEPALCSDHGWSEPALDGLEWRAAAFRTVAHATWHPGNCANQRTVFTLERCSRLLQTRRY